MKTQLKTKTMKDVSMQIANYFKNAEKHTFQRRYVWDKEYQEVYYKVIPVVLKSKLHYIAIEIDGEKVKVDIKDTSWVTTKNHYGMMKNEVFPQYFKHKSVRKNYEIQEKFDKIKKFIELNSEINADELEFLYFVQFF